MKRLFYIVFILFIATNAFAEPQKECKGNPDLCGECKTIRGRLSLYNGTPPLRIWVVGTKRLLGVVPSESEIMPDELFNIFKQNRATRVFADFSLFNITRPFDASGNHCTLHSQWCHYRFTYWWARQSVQSIISCQSKSRPLLLSNHTEDLWTISCFSFLSLGSNYPWNRYFGYSWHTHFGLLYR